MYRQSEHILLHVVQQLATLRHMIAQEPIDISLSEISERISPQEPAACFQLLSSTLETGQMTSIAPQNLHEQSESQPVTTLT